MLSGTVSSSVRSASCTRAVVKAKLDSLESRQRKMSEEKTEELPKIDKTLMREALQEILNDILAFCAFV